MVARTDNVEDVPGSKNMERPKSIAFNWELSLASANKKFSGFRSRCITP
jgi:hypothetical protein